MQLTYTIKDKIGWIELSNPPYNTLTEPVFADRQELHDFLNEPTIKAVIVKGKGRHFCAGADLKQLREQVDATGFAALLDEGKTLLNMISTATVPVIALISGSCMGAGLELALACHFRYATTTALLGLPESERDLLPGFGGTVRAQQVMGRGRALSLILSGKLISGMEAFEMGLVDCTTAPKDLEKEGLTFLRSLTVGRPPELIRAIMTAIHNGERMPKDEALREETSLFCEMARRHR